MTTQSEIRQVEVTFKGFTFTKDLTPNETLCSTCKGVGLVVRDYPYGIQGERRTDGKLFPYNNRYVGVCPDCYFGVRRVCGYCQKPFTPRHSLLCTCDKAKAERDADEAKTLLEKVAKATKLTEAEAHDAGVEMVYSEGHDEYYSWDGLYDLDAEDRETLGVVWATTSKRLSLCADSIIENACEDLHEDANDQISGTAQRELQSFLDAWAEKHGAGTTTYYPDYTRVIVLTEPICATVVAEADEE